MMKKILTVVLFSIASANAFAQEQPNVVAPSQPAASANVAAPGAAAPVAGQPQQPSMLGMALPFLVMLGIMYFLMIRPQQKRMKQHQALLNELKNGDEVVTNAGIIGTIAGMSEKVVTIEIAKNVQMKVLKSQVNQVVKGSINEIQAQ